MLFLGKHDYAMDERGRVPIPPRFRDALLQGIILTQGTPDRCIRAYPQEAFEAQAQLFLNAPVTTRTGRLQRRAYFGQSYQAEMDKQNRMLIPPQLRQYAGLGSQVVVLGTGEGIEIWDAAAYESIVEQEADDYLQTLDAE